MGSPPREDYLNILFVFKSPGIVVYGRSIEAFATVQQLLSLGVPGERLIFVKPPSYTTSLSVCDDGCEGDPFNEPIINETVTKILSDNHVTVYEDHVLASWHLENADKGEMKDQHQVSW